MAVNSVTTRTDPELEPPGAGIPPLEAWWFRVVGFGMVGPLVPWDLARRWFRREGEAVLKLTAGLPEDVLHRRVLIPRFPGIEDSSRHWSPAMTLAHLIIVSDAIAEIVVRLGRGERIGAPVRIEDVKPDQQIPDTVIADYSAMLDRFDRRMAEEVRNRKSTIRHAHPWVGPLTASQWLKLAAVHQRVHRRQIRSILRIGARSE
jgi:hypothetical protein